MMRNENESKDYLDLGRVINSEIMYKEVKKFIQRAR